MTPRPAALGAALAYAACGWPVLPCQPGRKTPATGRGLRDATADPAVITGWFARRPDLNLATATGAPGPDVLDIDRHGPCRTGYDALAVLDAAGLLDGAAAWVATPGGGLHAYYAGTGQRSARLARHHLDFKAAGGYVLAPPSRISGRPYQLLAAPGGRAALTWANAAALLEPPQPQPQPQRERQARPSGGDAERLAAWVARQEPGNRNAGLYWAACRLLDHDPAAGLGPLAAAARHARLSEREIAATLRSARTTSRQPARPSPSRDPEPEAAP